MTNEWEQEATEKNTLIDRLLNSLRAYEMKEKQQQQPKEQQQKQLEEEKNEVGCGKKIN